MKQDYEQVIIIGAGRSGTNMLRDLLTQMKGISTWPCDEINYIWRHGNRSISSDELAPDLATKHVKQYIQSSFDWVAQKYKAKMIIEKTCANSLRVPFVSTLCPEAKFLFIVRDGRDVVASSMKRWKASLDVNYIIKKARFVPIGDIAYYAAKYMKYHMKKWFSKEGQLGSWGPRYVGIEADLMKRSLAEVAAIQWSRCVTLAHQTIIQMPADRVLQLRYETFVNQPAKGLCEIINFLQLDPQKYQVDELVKKVSNANVGKWKNDLSEAEHDQVMKVCRTDLHNFGYI